MCLGECVCVKVCVYLHIMGCNWSSKDSLWKLVLGISSSTIRILPSNSGIINLGSKCFYFLRHLASPLLVILNIKYCSHVTCYSCCFPLSSSLLGGPPSSSQLNTQRLILSYEFPALI